MIQVKEVKPICFLFHRVQAVLGDLPALGMVGQELIAEAVSQKVMVTGPVHWHYVGFDGDLTKPFTLEISLPVSGMAEGYDGRFHFKRTDSFTALCLTHYGAWQNMLASYKVIMDHVEAKGLHLTGNNREVYVNVDLTDREANETEIQVGIRHNNLPGF